MKKEDLKIPEMIRPQETILEYFRRVTEGRSHDDIIRAIGVINAHLIGQSGILGYEEAMKRFTAQVLEFGDRFYETYEGDQELMNRIHENWGRVPYVLRMYRDCFAFAVDEHFKTLKSEISTETFRELEEISSRILDDCSLRRLVCMIQTAAVISSSVPDTISFTFTPDMIEENYDRVLNTCSLAFASALLCESSFVIRKSSESMDYITIFDCTGEKPLPLSEVQMKWIFTSNGLAPGRTTIFEPYELNPEKTPMS